MIPLHDDAPPRRQPIVKYFLIGFCAVVFLWQLTLEPHAEQNAIFVFGLIPAVVLGISSLPPALDGFPTLLTFITTLFMHGGLLHFFGNMAFLYVFGDNVEGAMTRMGFLAFYGLCGLAASIAHILSDPDSTIPLIGASGAIAGVLAAYLLLYPRARVLTVIPIFPIPPFVFWWRIPAWILLGIWFLMQFVNDLTAPEGGDGVAYMAHIGGFIAGLALTGLFKRRGVPYFAKRRPKIAAPRNFRDLKEARRPTQSGRGARPIHPSRTPRVPPRQRGPWD